MGAWPLILFCVLTPVRGGRGTARSPGGGEDGLQGVCPPLGAPTWEVPGEGASGS